MSRVSDVRLGLAEYLTGLQAELSKARAQAERDDLTFSVDRVTLEVDIFYTLTHPAKSPAMAKPEFWVLASAAQEAQAGAESTHPTLQHLIVQLTPIPEAADADEPEVIATIPSRLPPARLPDAK